ncbi:MAG: T9SS type A sorting domain-containing protein [Bacteroidia bacterium]|nr:T9SS type A sorting domain-containing protein [Bacteroidia bacterium]MDW8133559.1 T9SS type A sorting domain-containing protein [Bacteroidia bacterium]
MNNNLPPRSFDPPVLTIEAGKDTFVIIQFALAETVAAPALINYVYPNFAIYVDSLRLDGGNTYVSLYGQPSQPATYNTTNPEAGALRFYQDHRYKQVQDGNPPTYANLVVFQNPGGGSPSNPTPPRVCVQACIRGISPTPTADTLRIYLRGFVDPASINPFTGQSNDIPNKDTTNVMPTLGGFPLYADVWTKYPVRVTNPSSTISKALISRTSLYPNPAWGSVRVNYTLSCPAQVRVRVLSLAGQELLSENLGLRPIGESHTTLSLPAGVYMVEISAENEVIREKLIVLN